MVLILKKDNNITYPEAYCPISMLNIDYKIF